MGSPWWWVALLGFVGCLLGLEAVDGPDQEEHGQGDQQEGDDRVEE